MRNNQNTATPWYREGLRFQCAGCGGCCTGEPGYVWVNQDEIDAMAAALDMTSTAFEKEYVRLVGRRRSLREMDDGDCVFFEKKTSRCQLYNVRPRQCRTWPFWSSNLRKPENWQDTSEHCPGVDQGPTIPLDEIERQRGIIQI